MNIKLESGEMVIAKIILVNIKTVLQYIKIYFSKAKYFVK